MSIITIVGGSFSFAGSLGNSSKTNSMSEYNQANDDIKLSTLQERSSFYFSEEEIDDIYGDVLETFKS